MTETQWRTHELPSGTLVRVGIDHEREGVRFAVLEREHWHGFVLPLVDARAVVEWIGRELEKEDATGTQT